MKKMLINLMLYPNFSLRSLIVGNNAIECVSTYKILGVFSGGSRPSDKGAGGVGRSGHPDPEIWVGAVSKKFFFALWTSVWSKNRGWAPRTPPLGLPLVFINIKKLARIEALLPTYTT